MKSEDKKPVDPNRIAQYLRALSEIENGERSYLGEFDDFKTREEESLDSVMHDERSGEFPRFSFEHGEASDQAVWFARQIEARTREGEPTPDIIGVMAALCGIGPETKPEDCIDRAYELWQAAYRKTKEPELCSKLQIEDYLSKVHISFRVSPWPKNKTGEERKNLDLIPYLRLHIPGKGQDALHTILRNYLKDQVCESESVSEEFEKLKSLKFTSEDSLGCKLVNWWIEQKDCNLIDFPENSLGYLIKEALGLWADESPK